MMSAIAVSPSFALAAAVAAGVVTVVCICGVVSSPSSVSVVFTAAAVAVVVVHAGSWCRLSVTSTRGGGFKREVVVSNGRWWCQMGGGCLHLDDDLLLICRYSKSVKTPT